MLTSVPTTGESMLIVGFLVLLLLPDDDDELPPVVVVPAVGKAVSQLATRTMPPASPASRRMVERFISITPGDDRSWAAPAVRRR